MNQALTLGWDRFAGIYSEQLAGKPIALDTAKKENVVLFGDKIRLQLMGKIGKERISDECF